MKFEIFVFVEYGGQFRVAAYLNENVFTPVKSERIYDFLGYGKGIDINGWSPTCVEATASTDKPSETLHHKTLDLVKDIVIKEQTRIQLREVKKFDFSFHHDISDTKRSRLVKGFIKIYRVE